MKSGMHLDIRFLFGSPLNWVYWRQNSRLAYAFLIPGIYDAYFTWHVPGHRKIYLKWLYVRLSWETISLKIKSECIPACIMEYLTATLQSIRLSFGNDSLLIYKECKYVFIIPSLTWISEIGLILNWIKFWNQT